MNHPPDDALSEELLEQARRKLGKRLSELRNAQGLNQRDMARYAGTNQSAWQRLEKGEVDPRLSWLLRAQHYFGVDSLETLFGAAPSRRALGEDREE